MRDPSSRRSKVAIVTGASSGIGLALAQKLIASGYRVVANSRKITSAETLRATDNLKLVDGDMGAQKTAERVVGTAIQECGRVDLLVNNAGICIPKPCTDSTSDDFRSMTATNLLTSRPVAINLWVSTSDREASHISGDCIYGAAHSRDRCLFFQGIGWAPADNT
jgi:NADP-dependent 3-hydroxy acid dehydrogenase YdfG